jgi:hypothetical protein
MYYTRNSFDTICDVPTLKKAVSTNQDYYGVLLPK